MLISWKLESLGSQKSLLIQSSFDQKTKPQGSLGRLEELAAQIGKIQDREQPSLDRPSLLLFAGDHGVAGAHSVSPYPQSVSAAMLRNLAEGGAAASVLSRQLGWELVLINAGTLEALESSRILDRRIAPGTRDFCQQRSMDKDQYERALEIGADVLRAQYRAGCRLLALGEMGIGNSAAAAMIIHSLCEQPLQRAVSRGAGCNDQELERKLGVLQAARDFHGPLSDVDLILQTYAGFEMVMVAGAMMEAAALRVPIVIDGLIISSVALAAVKAQPALKDYLIFAHKSAALGHQAILDELGVKPLLDLEMRLGEGTGAALVLPILQSAVALLAEMASFASAAVPVRLNP